MDKLIEELKTLLIETEDRCRKDEANDLETLQAFYHSVDKLVDEASAPVEQPVQEPESWKETAYGYRDRLLVALEELAAIKAAVQEPVAWVWTSGGTYDFRQLQGFRDLPDGNHPLYAKPQPDDDAPVLVAWVEADPSAKSASLKDVICSMCCSTRWHWTHVKPETLNNVLFPIYTTPQR